MKKLKYLVLASTMIAFLGCEPMLLKKEVIPEFKAPADKALIIVLRKISVSIGLGGGGGEAKIFLDKKYVTGTSSNSVTSLEVDPGEHFVISMTGVKTPLKFDFKAGRVYYILQTTFPIPFVGTGNAIVPVDGAEGEENLASMRKDKCEYAYANPADPQDDLSDDDYEDIQKEWKEIMEEKPEEAKKSMDYPGF